MKDEAQLMREYHDFCSMHVNPPSFETWKIQQPQPLSTHEMASALSNLIEKGILPK